MGRVMNPSVIVSLLAAAGVVTCLGGCAVLTVDVDVYKGPLSNHAAVQEEQIKATLIGAKPILAALRNHLHEEDRKKPRQEAAGGGALSQDQEETPPPVPLEYKYCFWPGSKDVKEWLRDADAVRVNAVLSLYCDATPEELQAYVSQIQKHMDRIEVARSILEPDAERDSKLWRIIDANSYAKDSLGSHAAVAHVRRQIESIKREEAANRTEKEKLGKLEETDDLLRSGYDLLKRGYQELLNPSSAKRDGRWIGAIAQGHNKIVEARVRLPGLLTEAPFAGAPMADDANGQFASLQGADFVRRHLHFLCGTKLDRRSEEKVGKAVNDLADAFIDSRRALEQTFRVSLDLIDHLASKQGRFVNERRYLQASVRFMLSLVKCEALDAVMMKEDRLPPVQELAQRLNVAADDGGAVKRTWDKSTVREWKDALMILFEVKPDETSRQLQIAHLSFMSDSYDVPNKHRYHKYTTGSSRRFGICLAAPEEQGTDTLREALRSHAELAESIAGAAGLEHGRLAQGLEALIDDCLKKDASLPPPTGRNKEQKREWVQGELRLADALVNFAEKVLVIANYGTFLGLPYRSAPSKADEEERRNVRRYTDVLQAIGNSILVQANELHARIGHEEELQSAQKREIDAVNHAFGSGLVGGVDPNSGDAKKVLDNLIAALRYEYAAALKQPGTDAKGPERIAAALKTLYEQREDMVYIRPSSAYLRSSNPAASLQRNPEHMGSRNMLMEDLLREPLPAEEQRTLWDIDKQYWQNVNQVRVKGLGFSNYVVAKDDIGNWYIKSYRGDPNCIIQGARSAAMLAGVGTGAIASAGAAELATMKGKVDRAAAQTPPTAQQVRLIMNACREQVRADLDALVHDASGLAAKTRLQWSKDGVTTDQVTALDKSALSEANASMMKELKQLKDSKDPDEPQRLTAAFKEIKDFGDTMEAKIMGMSLDANSAANEQAIKKACNSVKKTISDFLLPRIERRYAVVEQQEAVLLALGNSQGKAAGQ